MASVTSSTHERKSKTNIVTKHGRLLLKHNAFTCVGAGAAAVLPAGHISMHRCAYLHNSPLAAEAL